MFYADLGYKEFKWKGEHDRLINQVTLVDCCSSRTLMPTEGHAHTSFPPHPILVIFLENCKP